MSEEEKTYFQTRAEIEIAQAQAAEHPEAVRSHYLLAGYYLDRVHGLPGEEGLTEQASKPSSGSAGQPQR